MTKKSTRSVGNVPGFGFQILFSTDDGKPQVYRELNEVATIPNSERDYRFYKLLEKNCDLRFCRNETSRDFNFITLEHFMIFALDSHGNCFGTIGGFSNIDDREYPVGYVTSDGKCGIVASCLKEFLELANFYPYWREIIEYTREGKKYSIENLENKYDMNAKIFLDSQLEISDTLNLKKNEKSIELLLSNLHDDQFVVFNHRLENIL